MWADRDLSDDSMGRTSSRTLDEAPSRRVRLAPAARHQDLALADVVGGPDDALPLHPLDQVGGPIVADRQAALDIAGRGLAIPQHEGDRLFIKIFLAAARSVLDNVRGNGLVGNTR